MTPASQRSPSPSWAVQSPRSPSTAWVVPSPISPISPIRISSDNGEEEPLIVPTPAMEVTVEAAPQLKIQVSEVNLLRDQSFIDGAKCRICIEGHIDDDTENVYIGASPATLTITARVCCHGRQMQAHAPHAGRWRISTLYSPK